MDKLPRNVRGNHSLSKSLISLLSDAWLLASDEGASEIRSAFLYQALLKSPYGLKHTTEALNSHASVSGRRASYDREKED